MTAMANNAGGCNGPQQAPMMYYYVVPTPASQQPFSQGGDGMNPSGQFDQPQAQFGAGAQPVAYYPDQGDNMSGVGGVQVGHMPTAALMPMGAPGNMQGQMMVLTTMMSTQQPQAPNMEQQQQQQEGGQANTGAWGGGMSSSQQAHDQQGQAGPQASAVQSRTPQGSKAFKIVDPNTKEEVKHPGGQHDGTGQVAQQQQQQQPQQSQPQNQQMGPQGGSVPMQQVPNQMQGQMQGQMPNQMQGQMQGQMPNQMQGQMPNQMQGQMPNQMQGQMQGQIPMGWQPFPAGMAQNMQQNMQSGNNMPQGNNMQQGAQGNMQQNMSQQNNNSMGGGGGSGGSGGNNMGGAPAPAAASTQPAPEKREAAPAPATKPRKGLKNMKLEKSGGQAADAPEPARRDAPAEASDSGGARRASAPTTGGAASTTERSATTTSGSTAPAGGTSTTSEGGTNGSATAGNSSSATTGSGGGTSATTAESQRQATIQNNRDAFNSRWPPAILSGGGQSTGFASSIKALNLEPMRHSPPPYRAQNKNPASRPAGNEPLLASGTANSTSQSQNQSSSQQTSQSAQAPAAVPKQPPQQQAQPPAQQPAPQPQPAPPALAQTQPAQMQAPAPAQMPVAVPGMQQMAMPVAGHSVPVMGMPPMQQQQAPVPAAPAPAAGGTRKGIKVKNAVLARPTKSKAEGDGADAAKTEEERKDAASAEAPPKEDGAVRKEDTNKAEDTGPAVSAAPSHIVAPTPMRRTLDPGGIFDRTLMLRIWRAHKKEVHPNVKGLTCGMRPRGKEESTPTIGGGKNRPGKVQGGDSGAIGRENFGTSGASAGGRNPKKPAQNFGPSPGAYVPAAVSSSAASAGMKREDEIERKVKSLLNKICPDNLKVIVDRLALIELFKAQELEFVISIIFSKALNEPHYCETYADMVYKLRDIYPTFPPEHEGEKAHTFTRVLLNTCQNEFESLPNSFEPTKEEMEQYSAEDLRLMMKKRKDKMLANMKFIGNLFLRQLLAVKVIGQVVHDLIGLKEELPEEHMIECVCELLQAIGYTLDQNQHGKILMTQFSARLVDLKRSTRKDGKSAFSKRIQFQIQNLLDLRSNDWKQKLFKEQATTREEVRKAAVKEQRAAAKGAGTEVMFAQATAGMRPAYIDDLTAKSKRPKEAPAKPVFDEVYVKRVFTYYAEERNGDGLQADWEKAQPNAREAREGVVNLLRIGFDDRQKEEVVGDCITELVSRKLVSWEMLRDALSPYLETLEDMLMDTPKAYLFIHTLLSSLLRAFGKDFNATILKSLPPPSDGSDLSWGLLVGALKKLKEKAGTDPVRKALDHSGFGEACCKAKKCSQSELKRNMQEEGVL